MVWDFGRRTLWVGAVGLALMLCSTAYAAPLREDQLKAANALVDAAATKTPSLAVVVRRGGEVVFQRYRGKANLELDVAADERTVYAIASISKSLTALTALREIAAGRLAFETTVGEVLPDAKGAIAKLTVRQLLTHTSGLPDFAFTGVVHDWWRDYSHDEITKHILASELQFTPGTRMIYTNSGYHLLGAMLETRAGKPLQDLVAVNVTGPLGVPGMVYNDRERVILHRAAGYVHVEGAVRNAAPLDPDVDFASGAFAASAPELARYGEALGKLAQSDPELWSLATSRSRMPDGTELSYLPAALIESRFEGRRKLAHAGSNPGAQSHLAVFPDDDISISVLTNDEEATDTGLLSTKLARVLLDAPASALKDLPVPVSEGRALSGQYSLETVSWGPRTAEVSWKDNRIWVRFVGSVRGDDSPPFPLASQGRGVFLAPFDDEFRLYFNGRGAARWLTIDNRDASISAPLIKTAPLAK